MEYTATPDEDSRKKEKVKNNFVIKRKARKCFRQSNYTEGSWLMRRVMNQLYSCE